MAGKGGGSWKVAYADFVTAMMAFFLVMWIGAQDVKVRQSVANYFVDPSGVDKKPVKRGAVLSSVSYGPITDGAETKLTHGREQPADLDQDPGGLTRTAYNWVTGKDTDLSRWRAAAQVCRQRAAQAPDVVNKTADAEAVAARELAKQLRSEFIQGLPQASGQSYQDLFFASIQKVNWDALAEDLLKSTR